ncbi:olfactory receptor 2AT4-like [Silurus meridionalis]|uniref:olfactory receptor 2AT4-like n=1 Tax=Silurus meridionalis TaxID=175797 RepID=UPI001EEB128A|nr:olfactory receptor 2AT4-like [Silurus meridionalis]
MHKASRMITLYKNSTSNIAEFVLQGFTGIPAEYHGLVGFIFLLIYLMLAFGNIFILVFVACEKSLQKPTYIIFCNLALSDLGFGTTILPRIMAKYWMSEIISIKACFTQFHENKSNKEGRYKTFLTCTPQLFIISMYYLPRSFVYVAFILGYRFETNLNIALILMYGLFPALINPLIYCFRTKEIKDTIMRKIYQRKVRLNQKLYLSKYKKNIFFGLIDQNEKTSFRGA